MSLHSPVLFLFVIRIAIVSILITDCRQIDNNRSVPLEDISNSAFSDPEIKRIFEKIKKNNENVSVSDAYRLFFNREPHNSSEYPALAGLSQGRYPIPQNSSDFAKISSTSCKKCHSKEHDLWQNSLHSKSFTNPRFRDAFEKEPMAWCLNCHAPYWYEPSKHRPEINQSISKFSYRETYTTDRTVFFINRTMNKDDLYLYKEKYKYKEMENPLNQEGVNCAVCHVRNGKIISGSSLSSVKKLRQLLFGGHSVSIDSSLKTPNFCAGCHEFTFPSSYYPAITYSSKPMQNTVTQFFRIHKSAKRENHYQQDSLYPNCNGCHIHKEAHASSGILNLDAFKNEFLFRFSQNKQNKELIVLITIPKIGHNFPTGDLFRQIHIKAYDQKENLVGFYKISLDVNNNTFVTESDTSLKPDDTQSVFQRIAIPITSEPVKCSVEYHFEGKIGHLLSQDIPVSEKQIQLFYGDCKSN